MSGVERIAKERQRQIEVEGWTPEHDDEHVSGEMAMAAACYAAPQQIYTKHADLNLFSFSDPWPWDRRWDKRHCAGKPDLNNEDAVPDPSTYTDEQKIELLTKSGALAAAEIDRFERKIAARKGKH